MVKRFLRIRLILLIVTGLISLWFFGNALLESWKWMGFTAQSLAEVVKWEVKELSSSHYVLVAHYHYQVDGKQFSGKTQFSSPFYLNYYAAQSGLKAQQAKPVYAWYRKSRPALSTLEKRFPKKEFTYALLTAGVLVYFYFIRTLLIGQEKVTPKAQ